MADPEDLDMPTYSKDVDTPQNNAKALSVVQAIALKEPVLTSDEDAEQLGKYLVKALLFLHEGRAHITVDAILTLLRLDKENINSIYISEINDEWYFRIILVSGFKHITFDNIIHPAYRYWISAILNEALALTTTVNGCTIAVLKTINHLIKKYHVLIYFTVDDFIYETLKVFLYSSNLPIRKLSRRIVKYIISEMLLERKYEILDTLLEDLVWEKSAYLIGSYVIYSVAPSKVASILPRVMQITMTSMRYNNLSLAAGKLFTAAVSMVKIPSHVDIVIPLIRRWTYRNRNDLFINNVNKYMLPTCIRLYRANFYLQLRQEPVNPKVFARAFYIAISNGHIDAEDLVEDVEKFLNCPNQQVRHDAFRALCTVQKYNNLVTKWRIVKVYECLSLSRVNINDAILLKDFKTFMRNIAEFTCDSIKLNPQADGLLLITRILNYLYQRCQISFNLFTEESIETAYELILILDSTFQAESELANTAMECEYPEYVRRFYRKHQSHMQTYAQIILNNAVTKDQYFKKAFVALHSVLLEHLPLIDIENAFKNNKHLCSDPTFASGQKFVDLVRLLIKRKCFESRTVTDIANELHELIATQYCNLIVNKKIETFELHPLFSCLGASNALYMEKNVKPSENYTNYVFATSEAVINIILEIVAGNEKDLVVVNSKLYKCMEYALLNAIEVMSSVIAQREYRQDLLKVCATVSRQIISKSNMKRPVMRAATFLQSICNRAVKIPAFFDEIVELSLEEALHANSEYQKIRKTPESRLVLHAIAKAGCAEGKQYLNRIISYMLDFLESKEDGKVPSALASTLNCLEIFVSDKSISNATLPYVGRIVKCCMEEFVKPDWIIKNACLQVFQSLVYRILGQAPSGENRPVSINEIFLYYPNLIPFFETQLTGPENHSQDTVVATLMFLAQTYPSAQIMQTQRGREILMTFLHILAGIVKTHKHYTGRYAASAYTALIPEDLIPSAINKIVAYIKSNFKSMSKNVFKNLITMLKDLKEKYFTEKQNRQVTEESVIHKALNDLILSARSFKKYKDYNIFSLLNLNVNALNEVMTETLQLFKTDYLTGMKRIKCYNNLSYIFEAMEIDELPAFLECCLKNRLCTTMQLSCLDSVTKRLRNEENFDAIVQDLLLVILKHLFSMSIEENTYLLTCYCNFVMLLFEYAPETIEFSDIMRSSLKHSFGFARSIHYTVIYAAVLSKIDDRDAHEKYIAHSLLDNYGSWTDTVDEQNQILLAVTLKYLLKAVESQCRRKVLDIAFILLIADYCGEEICTFLISTLNIRCADVQGTIKSATDYQVIRNYLGDHTEAVSFLLDMAALLSKEKEVEAPFDSFFTSDENDLESRKKYMVHSIYNGLRTIFTQYTEEDFVAAIQKRLHT